MLEIPLNANVLCVDGYAGKSTHIIVDARQRTVTHFVVKDDKRFADNDWLVPIEHIVASSHDQIRLDLTIADLSKLPLFTSTRFVDYGEDYSTYLPDALAMEGAYGVPTVPPSYIPMLDKAVPLGEKVLMQGATVRATDGAVGTVDELLVDEASGQITHFTLEEGHFWGKHEVTLPLTAVDHFEEGFVYLKLDKKGIHSLPSVPRKGKEKKGERPTSFEFIARIFDAPNKAADALTFVKELQHQQHGAIKIHNSALLVKDAGGKLKVTETGNLSANKGTGIGAVTGGLLGALAGPVGIVIGITAGAGLGRASTHWFDHGLPDAFVQRLQEHLQPNTSALILLVEHHYLKPLSEQMADMEGVVMQYTLTDEVVEQMLKEQQGHTSN